jgi:hypothetical protein
MIKTSENFSVLNEGNFWLCLIILKAFSFESPKKT